MGCFAFPAHFDHLLAQQMAVQDPAKGGQMGFLREARNNLVGAHLVPSPPHLDHSILFILLLFHLLFFLFLAQQFFPSR